MFDVACAFNSVVVRTSLCLLCVYLLFAFGFWAVLAYCFVWMAFIVAYYEFVVFVLADQWMFLGWVLVPSCL